MSPPNWCLYSPTTNFIKRGTICTSHCQSNLQVCLTISFLSLTMLGGGSLLINSADARTSGIDVSVVENYQSQGASLSFSEIAVHRYGETDYYGSNSDRDEFNKSLELCMSRQVSCTIGSFKGEFEDGRTFVHSAYSGYREIVTNPVDDVWKEGDNTNPSPVDNVILVDFADRHGANASFQTGKDPEMTRANVNYDQLTLEEIADKYPNGIADYQ